MKLNFKVYAHGRSRERQLEFNSGAEFRKSSEGQLRFLLDGKTLEAGWAEVSPGVYSLLFAGRSYQVGVGKRPADAPSSVYDVTVEERRYRIEVEDPRLGRRAGQAAGAQGPDEILAPMPGRVVKVLVAENQLVERGEGLVVIEAMKMQNELRAPRSGRVQNIFVREGTGVESGAKLLRLV